MHVLQAVSEHRSVYFIQQILINPDLIIGRDSEKVSVKCGVMNFA